MVFLRSIGQPDIPATLAGAGVVLRPPRLADYEAWARVRGDSRAFLKPWEPTWPADDLGKPAYRRRLRRYAEERRTDQGYAFFLFRTPDEALLGGLTLSNLRRGVAQCCTLGYWMGEAYAGKGLMTAGVRAVLPFVFDHLRLQRIEAACLPHNAASISLLERVGFTREGLARRYLCIDGIWQDHLLFGLVRGDPTG
jgi:ribosomal-protein-alanine N-acetyltransferase